MAKKRPSTQFVTPHASAQRWPRRSSMPSVFTAFVRSLQGEQTPDADLFHDAWHGLRAALAKEMKRRGLWQNPPRYLGVCGWERWDAEELDVWAPAVVRPRDSALGELVADCYAYIFVDRLQSLKKHLADKPDIDGLILLNVRHFLHERQKAHDPLGFRIFEQLQAVVADALARGDLHRLGGDERIRNDTFLAFSPAADPTLPADLEAVAMRWNDDLLPALVTARGRSQTAVVARLRRLLLDLPRQGIEAFRFRELLEPLKNDARLRWAALLGDEEESTSGATARGPVQSLAPAAGSTVESRQSFDYLARSVGASIHQLKEDPRTRAQLSTLWQYLRRHLGGGGEAADGDLSHRQLAKRLGIPRERFPLLFASLRQLVALCRNEGSTKRASPANSRRAIFPP